MAKALPAYDISRIDTYRKKRAALEPWRQARISFIQDVHENLRPGRAVLGDIATHDSDKETRQDETIITSIARLDGRTLQAALMYGCIPQSSPWQNLTVPPEGRRWDQPDISEDPDVNAWLYRENEEELNDLNGSNFYQKMALLFEDAMYFKCGFLLAEMDTENVVNYTDVKPGTYALGYDENGKVNQFAREEVFTLGQLVKKFGLKNCSLSVQEAYKTTARRQDKVRVVHLVCPNEDRNQDSYKSGKKAFSNVWFEEKTNAVDDKFLNESGFDEFPGVILEWDQCPAWLAMGDIKQLYKMELDKLYAVELANKPPLTGPAALVKLPIQQMPSGFTADDSKDAKTGLRPVHEVRLDLNALMACIEKVERAIHDAFFIPAILTLASLEDRPGRTATEILQRKQELMQQFIPVVQAVNPALDHNQELVYSFRVKLGYVAPWPDVMRGRKFGPDYISPINQSQKMAGMAGMETVIAYLERLVQIKPNVADKVNLDQVMDELNKRFPMPPGFILTDEETARIREAQAQAQMQAEGAKAAALEARAARDLAEAKPTDDSLLAMVAKGAQGAPA